MTYVRVFDRRVHAPLQLRSCANQLTVKQRRNTVWVVSVRVSVSCALKRKEDWCHYSNAKHTSKGYGISQCDGTAPPALKRAKASMAIVYFTPVVIAIGKGSHKCENRNENK